MIERVKYVFMFGQQGEEEGFGGWDEDVRLE